MTSFITDDDDGSDTGSIHGSDAEDDDGFDLDAERALADGMPLPTGAVRTWKEDVVVAAVKKVGTVLPPTVFRCPKNAHLTFRVNYCRSTLSVDSQLVQLPAGIDLMSQPPKLDIRVLDRLRHMPNAGMRHSGIELRCVMLRQ